MNLAFSMTFLFNSFKKYPISVMFWVLKGQFHKNKFIIKLYTAEKNKVKIINFTHICYISSHFHYIFMSYCIVNRSCIKLTIIKIVNCIKFP